VKRDPRIIIVEDDRDLAIHIRSEFRMNGYEAYKAHSAEECIKKMEELDNKVEAIAIDGKTATDRGAMLIVNIKKRNPSIKVFVLADRNLEEAKTRVLDYGADEFAVKPLSTESFVEKVDRLLIEENLY
jgi:DNA-binding response OmpR family regulator